MMLLSCTTETVCHLRISLEENRLVRKSSKVVNGLVVSDQCRVDSVTSDSLPLLSSVIFVWLSSLFRVSKPYNFGSRFVSSVS